MKTSKINLLFVLLFPLLFACNSTNNTETNPSADPNEGVLSILNETRTGQYFSDDTVSVKDITAILESGRNATSGRNMQPWFFTAILNKGFIKDIAAKMPMGPPPGFKGDKKDTPPPPPSSTKLKKAQFADAPAAIAIAGGPNTSFDLGLACENMVIAATALGYGTKIVAGGVRQLNTPENKTLLGIPEEMNVEVILLVGKIDTTIDLTADGVTGPSTRKPLNEVSKVIR